MEDNDIGKLYMRLRVAGMLRDLGPRYNLMVTEIMKGVEVLNDKLQKVVAPPPPPPTPKGPPVHEVGEEPKRPVVPQTTRPLPTPGIRPSDPAETPAVERRSE